MNRHQTAVVGIFAVTCLAGLVVYVWACRAILHRIETGIIVTAPVNGPETISE